MDAPMSMTSTPQSHAGSLSRRREALDTLTRRLLDAREPSGHWTGKLSSSALSTATAIVALTLAARRDGHRTPTNLTAAGIRWLAAHQNDDGGFGDTTLSLSNISTTALCWAALSLEEFDSTELVASARTRARDWMEHTAGSLEPRTLAARISDRYGKDRTFSVPILTVLALANLLGPGREGWAWVPQLPFELAAVPQQWYRWVRLPVVSYALPALIAIGHARHRRRPSRNLLLRLLRQATSARTLRTLDAIQPTGGGFLEATPLTSFVVMSLIAAGHDTHPVVRRGEEFLARSVRADGSWPIDTNLATWVTTLSLNALAGREDWRSLLPRDERETVRQWLIDQQYGARHPYTGAEPGGWAWTNLPGGVPDADDTPGALLALHALGDDDAERGRAEDGVIWLLGLQNADGGMPTFCRGWGALPFDRSSPDLTAHAIRAWSTWRDRLSARVGERVDAAIRRAVRYLEHVQRPDGSWHPLWFGNQHAPDDVNPTYGTARVLQGLLSLRASPKTHRLVTHASVARAVDYLVETQHGDGGWSGAGDGPPSIEETALAVAALAHALRTSRMPFGTGLAPDQDLISKDQVAKGDAAVARGVDWLLEETENGHVDAPSPIGFYFAKLWYFEHLYPRIFTVEAFAAVEALAAVDRPAARR